MFSVLVAIVRIDSQVIITNHKTKQWAGGCVVRMGPRPNRISCIGIATPSLHNLHTSKHIHSSLHFVALSFDYVIHFLY